MKEKFSKLLLGEDMSGGGNGVCSAVALSNAITNLYGYYDKLTNFLLYYLSSRLECRKKNFFLYRTATVFGHCYKLEPLPAEKKSMWRREMDCLVSVCDYIVEFFPSSQTLPDGTTLDVRMAHKT